MNNILTIAIIINLMIVSLLGFNVIESKVMVLALAVLAGAESVVFLFSLYALYKAEGEI